tara:strand:+ start:1206 stop:4772 length:3567 start_codon:yes stop_codon:yes gene_type:complete
MEIQIKEPITQGDYCDEETLQNISWEIIRKYFDKQYLERLVRHQRESYNYFINNQIKETIQMFNPVIIHSEHDKDPETGIYSLEIEINFDNFQMFLPKIYENNGAVKLMFPQEARLRNFTYSSPMMIDINVKVINRTGKNLSKVEILHKKLPNTRIGAMPVMLKSSICVLTQNKELNCDITGECKFDPGGYFIVSGSEKIVLGQERAAENKIMCFDIKKNNNKWRWLAEIKSVPIFKCISPKQINITIANKNNGFGHEIEIQIPRVKKTIPIFVLFRALGIISDKEICQYIILNLEDEKMKKMKFALKASIIHANKYNTKEKAFDYIVQHVMFMPINMTKEQGIKKKREFAQNVLDNDLFPHCITKQQKIYFLGMMVNKLLQTSFEWRKPDDRDSYLNKRVDLVGVLLNNLFRNYFNKLVKDMNKQVVREINTGSWKSNNKFNNIINETNIYKIVKATTIENGIKRALATGDFGIKNSNSNKSGVAQVLNRLTYISSLSHLRRINTPIDKSGKLIPPRKLHPTQIGYICPAECPEGQSVGVVKNLSYMALITMQSDINIILNVLKDRILPIEDFKPIELYEKVKVIVNGNWLGITDKPVELHKFLKECKYSGILNIYTSVVFSYGTKELLICNYAGRLVRPIFRVKNNKLLFGKKLLKDMNKSDFKWDNLLVNHEYGDSILEYIDPEEQNASLIAMTTKDLISNKDKNDFHYYTHSEIHPSTILGILASCIPFPDHNQSPRNTYQCAMGKQAMGVYVTNFKNRMDKTAYVQTYIARPLVDTRLMNFINLHKIPSGFNAIVAIMSYSGYNQEDSVIMNEGSLKRGLFSATIYHTEKDEDKKIHGDEEIRCKPDKSKTKGIKFANYNKLNKYGVIPENTLLENKDILMGKVIPIKENRNDPTKTIKYKDQSKIYRTTEESYIDKNYIHRNGDGYTFGKFRTRTYRVPNIGDKFSSRHGQKGTCGVILPEEDMPCTAEGIRPDIIVNPHAIPSRMTIAHLKETLLGKVLLQLGLFGDGTCFGNLTVAEICEKLQETGYERHGNEILYNGMTGEQIETDIYLGPTFYQRLKHMVNDKAHARAIGPMVVMTRQPSEGRARDGGLRFGEMERDCMISHGASAFTKDRIYDSSDKYKLHVCRCGMFAIFNSKKKIHKCKYCNNTTDFKLINIPYSCKLLFQELLTMNIAPRIITN